MAVQELGVSPMLLEELAALVGTKHEDIEVLDFCSSVHSFHC